MTYGPRPGDETDADEALHLVYDAWNRLVAAYKDNGTTAGEKDANDTLLAKYQYDGLHRRIAKLKPNGENWDRTDYYYSTDWQVLEERAETVAGETTPADDVKVQYVWDLRYIDAPVLRWRDTGGDPDLDETLYFCNDANMNVTALVEPDGDVVERVVYDPYGKPTFYDADWANPSDSSAYANEVLYCGYRFDTETGLYHVRYRPYHPTLGRWMQRDPIEYADGMALYEYTRTSPLSSRDPYGLQTPGGGIPRDDPGSVFRLPIEPGSFWEWTDTTQMNIGWPYESYSVEVRDQWREGKGGTYTGNDKMGADLAKSPAIEAKIRSLIEPPIMMAGMDLPCYSVEEADTSIEFGTDVNDPIELSGELRATARSPDRVTCQVSMAYGKRCDPEAACCPSVPYIAFASCRLQDRYDWHDPRNEDGTIKKAYENTTWAEKHGLDVMWSHQQRLTRQGKNDYVSIDVAFEVDLDGELCEP